MNNIKQSITDWSFYDAAIEPLTFYKKIKKMGYDAVEMVPKERRQAVIDAGLVNLNFGTPGMQVGLNNLVNHNELVPAIIKAIDEAAKYKIPNVIIFSGNRNGQSDELGIENCLVAIKQVVKHAEDNNIVLLFEMLNSIDHVDYQADSSSYGFKIVKSIDSPNLKALYDVYHMFRMKEDVIKDIQDNVDLIGHIHLAGSPKRNCIADENDIDYKPIFDAIKSTDYSGYLGQEFMVTNDRFDELQRAFILADS